VTIRFLSKITGVSKVKQVFSRITTGVQSVLAKKRLEDLLLKRTLERFDPPGSRKYAQKAPPIGKPWAPLSPYTRRKKNVNRSQKLVDTGKLRSSIGIVKRNMEGSVLQSPTGGGFSIGIKPGSKASKYARIHQFGGYAGVNRKVYIPARRYLGIDKTDIVSVQRLVNNIMKKSVQ